MIDNNASYSNVRSPVSWAGIDPLWPASTESLSSPFSCDWYGRSVMTWSITRRQLNPTVERLRNEIAHFESEYRDGWDGPGTYGPTPESIQAIRSALDAIPSGIVLPKTMLSPNGDIGLYWDFPNGSYADLSSDTRGRLTFYARDSQGTEHFNEVQPAELDVQWYWARLGRLGTPGNLAA